MVFNHYPAKTAKMNSLCHQYRVYGMCSLTRLCTVGWPASISQFLISLKMIMESSINGWYIIPFKKFGMVRVKSFKESLVGFICEELAMSM